LVVVFFEFHYLVPNPAVLVKMFMKLT
jgi:hypothetical protein